MNPDSAARSDAVDAFIEKWKASSAAERANSQSFANELCVLLGVPEPEPQQSGDARNTYVFEKAVVFNNGDGTTSQKRADLYLKDCFVCEAKQGSDPQNQRELFPSGGTQRRGTAVRGTGAWNRAMIAARNQAERYARFLGWPPFLIVVDVGHVIELYADFSGSGQNGYTPFPDPAGHRIAMDDLRDPAIRERLAKVWTEPHVLDPSKHAARITRKVAAKLADLAKSLESEGRAPGSVAEFLMRCLFTMFAEDVDLLPRKSFTNLLKEMRDYPQGFAPSMEQLWRAMDKGGPSPQLKADLRRFNGALFRNAAAIALKPGQIDLLIEAAEAKWRDVEPAIFGTLLERALDPRERHKLGAHYTPRAYVERLVMPTIIEPLREEWRVVQATAIRLEAEGKHEQALDALRDFHRHLASTRVLDPACGSGNFLYVTMEHMKRLEGEVIDVLADLDPEAARLELAGHTVTPEQFLGIEVNERAAVIAEMVLWIGFLQWHFRTSKRAQVPAPVLRNYGNIGYRDAVLDWDERRPRTDEHGRPITHWDGRTTKPHPVTGREVPDESAQVEDYEYINPRPAKWPEADYVVGNPPYIGTSRMRHDLGDGYTEAIRRTLPDVPESADYVMYWWDKAADLVRAGKIRRFGFITTNSLRQTFNRRVLQRHMTGKNRLSLLFAIPDHPWVDAADGAAVRVAMTVAAKGDMPGELLVVTAERDAPDERLHREVDLAKETGPIHSNLRVGIDLTSTVPLRANEGLSNPGVKLHGAGFIVTPEQATQLGLGSEPKLENHIRGYRNGRDLTATPRGVMVIDLFGLSDSEVREQFPAVYQWVLERVKPDRDQNRRASYRKSWWIFGEPRGELRPALAGLLRYIATVETSKHRFFQFLDEWILPDNMLVCIALDDAWFLGVLSSRVHVTWALAAGGRLGVGNDPRYNKTRCFDPFPFPDPPDALKERVRALGEELDAHRKARQAAYPDLTVTQMYNVLEELRERRALTDREKAIHDKGLVGVLKDIHDRLDAAVIEAYGWPADIPDDEILGRLVALNKERAAEEARGTVRWLRPEYQNPEGRVPEVQEAMEIAAPVPEAAKAKWPTALPDQMRLVRGALDGAGQALTAEQVAAAFKGARRKRVDELLETLVSVGQARMTDDGRFAAR